MSSQLEKIKALQNKLKAVQAQKQKQKLSERNMVEIISKITELNLLSLIMSTDGKEYITPGHLTEQIKSTVENFGGGRLSISEITDHVKVEYSTVERFVLDITKECQNTCKSDKSKNSSKNLINNTNFSLINNQLISTKYFTNKSAEIAELVIYNGRMTLPEIAIKYDLPLDTLITNILPRIKADPRNFAIQNEPDPVIYAQEYQLLAKMKILGSLRAVNYPVILKEVLSLNGLDKNFDILSVVKDFLKKSQLNGELGQGKTTFVPSSYVTAQKNWIASTFKSNLYIDYDLLSKIGIGTDQKKLVTDTLKAEGAITTSSSSLLFIKNGVLSRDLFADLEAQLFETERFLAVTDIMPEFIDDSEYDEILGHFLDEENFVLIGEIIFKKSFIDKTCFENSDFKKLILKAAEKEAEVNYKKRVQAKMALPAIDADEDDFTSSSKSKKSKRAGKKGKNKSSVSHSQTTDQADVKESSDFTINAAFGSSLPEKSEFSNTLLTFLEAKFAEDFSYGSTISIEEISIVIVDNLQGKIFQTFSKYCNDIILQLAEKKNNDIKKFSKTLETKLQNRFDLARISNNGISAIKKAKTNFNSANSNLLKSCDQYLTQKIFQEIFDILLILASGVGPFDIENSNQFLSQASSGPAVLSTKDRKNLKSSLTGSVKDLFSDQKFEFRHGEFEDHLENLLELASNECLSISRIKIKCDKRKDKEFITNFLKAQTEDDIFKNCAPHEKLHILTVLIFNVATKGCLICISGKAVPDLISFISTFVMADNRYDEILDLLVDVKESIIEKLKNGSIGEVDQDLEGNLEKLKKLVEGFEKKAVQSEEKESEKNKPLKSSVKSGNPSAKISSSPKVKPSSPSVHQATMVTRSGAADIVGVPSEASAETSGEASAVSGSRSPTTRDKSQESNTGTSSEVEHISEIGKLEDFEVETKSSSEEEVVIEKPKGRRRNRRAD